MGRLTAYEDRTRPPGRRGDPSEAGGRQHRADRRRPRQSVGSRNAVEPGRDRDDPPPPAPGAGGGGGQAGRGAGYRRQCGAGDDAAPPA